MSIRRAPRLPAAGPVGPVGRPAAAPAGPSLFERTLVKEAINAHLQNVTRRLKREPISQVNPFLVGRQNMIIDELKGGGGGGGGGGGAPAPNPRIDKMQSAIDKLRSELAQLKNGGGGGGAGGGAQLKQEMDAEIEKLKQQLDKRVKGLATKRAEDNEAADQRLEELEEQLDRRIRNVVKGRKELEKRLKARIAKLEGDLPAAEDALAKLGYLRPFREGDSDSTDGSTDDADASTDGSTDDDTRPYTPLRVPTTQAVSIAQVNPWLASFRTRLLMAQKEALQDDENLRKEISNYQAVIQGLREKLTKSKDEADAVRTARIQALEKALEEEKAQVQDLMTQLDDKSSLAETYENQWRAVGQQLQQAEQDLKESDASVKTLKDDVTRLTVEIAVAKVEIQTMEEKLKEAARMDALTTAEREVLKTQVETAVEKLSDMEETLEQFREAAEKAQEQFDEELARNKTLLEELKTRRATLEKEAENLETLTDKEDKDAPV